MRSRVSRSLVLLIVTIPLLAAIVQGHRALGQTSSQSQSPTVDDNLDFGSQEIGTKTTKRIIVKNRASSVLRFTARTDKPDFSIRKGCQPDDSTPQSQCVLEIQFSPVGRGVRSGKLQIEYQVGADAKSKKPLTVSLRGEGLVPEIAIAPVRLRFPAQPVGIRSDPQTVLLTNNTKKALQITNVLTSGEFQLEAPAFPQILNSGASTAALVSFRPVRPGNVSGALTILGGLRPRTVELSGRSAGFLAAFKDSICADVVLALILCLVYWLVMVFVRWHRVAMPTRELLRAQIASLQAELPALAPIQKVDHLMKLLERARELIDGTILKRGQWLADFLFWSRGQELTGWGYVHEVEIQRVPLLSEATLQARLEVSEQRLRTMNDAVALNLANVINQALKADPQVPIERRQALFAEALTMIYDCEDRSYAWLVSWQNKTSWLVGSGLLLIVVLTNVFCGKGVLLLVGGAGGLISRMSRSLDRKNVPTDYGASWTYLFLSPVAGALGAWAGILLSDILQQAQILGPTFNASWNSPTAAKTLAIALVFGFSERLLDGVLDKLVGKQLGDQTANANVTPQQPSAQQQPLRLQPEAAPPKITSDPKLDDATLNQPYTATLKASGGSGKLKWSQAPGSTLLAGLQLASDGTISGTPTTQGTFTFKAVVTDESSKTDSKDFTLTVN